MNKTNRVNWMLMGYLAEKNAIYFPNKDFLVEKNKRITFRQFHERTDALATGLLERGLSPGGRVSVFTHNSIELVEAYFGAIKAGGIASPINVRLNPEEISEILDDADPSFIIAGSEHLPVLEAAGLGDREDSVFVIGGHADEYRDYETLLGAGGSPGEPDTRDDDTALLIYTSGTTGRPKGVMLTHRNLVCDSWATCVSRRLDRDEISLVTAPLYQSGALGSMLGNVLRGNTVVLLNGFEPVEVLSTIQREKVTNALLVPTMIYMLLECPQLDDFDLTSMKTIIYGAAPMPVQLLKKAMKKFGWEFMGACGATETGPAYIAFLDPSDHMLDGTREKEIRLNSIGREGINAQVRIFDPDERPLPEGEVGEIVVRGPHIMKGYWKKPGETEEALRGGWYHTGDMGRIDEAGYIYIVDRKKDMIISGGFNIYPREIENALAKHEAVLEAAVVGVPHQVWGETPKAYVVFNTAAEKPAEDELMHFLRNRLASYKLPKGGIVYLDELPRNASGKVLKKLLRTEAKKERR